nr:unnamed protein product [Callosobruchus chinensis]
MGGHRRRPVGGARPGRAAPSLPPGLVSRVHKVSLGKPLGGVECPQGRRQEEVGVVAQRQARAAEIRAYALAPPTTWAASVVAAYKRRR